MADAKTTVYLAADEYRRLKALAGSDGRFATAPDLRGLEEVL